MPAVAASIPLVKCLAAALLGVPEVVGRGRPVHQEGCTLGLPDGIKATNPDVGVGEGLGGISDLSQHLGSVIASEHGQLVHGPVPARHTCLFSVIPLGWMINGCNRANSGYCLCFQAI